VKETFPTP